MRKIDETGDRGRAQTHEPLEDWFSDPGSPARSESYQKLNGLSNGDGLRPVGSGTPTAARQADASA